MSYDISRGSPLIKTNKTIVIKLADCCPPPIPDRPVRSAEVIMVTFAETTQVSPMKLCEPSCMAATLSPGLRRKKMLWQNAVKHIIIQQELSAQVRK